MLNYRLHHVFVPILGLFTLTVSCSVPAARAPSWSRGPVEARLEHHLNRLEQWGFSGGVLVAVGNRILLADGYGHADVDGLVPVEPGTIFDIGSLTKEFTAAAILLLQDQGALSISDSIGKYFDEVPPDKASITLHHLLTHSAGIAREVGQDWEEMSRGTFESRALAVDLLFEPGQDFSYSNAGYALLASIVERTAGISYHDFMEREIFRRAGLESTGFIGRSPDPRRTALAGSGSLAGQNPSDWQHTWNHRGSGGILSTIGDFLRWRRALASGQVVSAEALALMRTPHVNGYGYGSQIEDRPYGTAYHGTGLWYSFTSSYLEVPGDSLLILAVSNRRIGPYQPASVVVRDLTQEYFEGPATSPPALADRHISQAGLAGTYRTDSGESVFVAVEDDHLRLDGVGQRVFDVLFSDASPSPGLLAMLRSRTIAILEGVGHDDFDTLRVAAPKARYERYRRLLPPIWAQRTDSLGALQRVDLLGVVDRGTALDAFASLQFEEGREGVRLTWSREGVLWGLANEDPRMDDGLMTFRETEDGTYAAYHFETRVVMRIRFKHDRLAVLAEDGSVALEATRTTP